MNIAIARRLLFPSWVPRRRRGRPALPRSVFLSLYAFIWMFCLNNVYQSPLRQPFILLKWAAFALLLSHLLYIVSIRGTRSLSANAGLPVFLLAMILFSVVASERPGHSVIYFVSLTLGIMVSWLLAWYLDRRDRLAAFFAIVETVGRAVIYVSFLFYALRINLGRAPQRFSGWTDNPNTLGLILAPILVILMARMLERGQDWKLKDGVPFLLGVIVLLETASRASMLWVAGAALAFWVVRRGMTTTVLLTGLALAAVALWLPDLKTLMTDYWLYRSDYSHLSIHSDLLSGRTAMWELAFQLWQKNPLLGYGLESAARLIAANPWLAEFAQGANFHNTYINTLVESGVVGLVGLSIPLVVVLVRGFNRTRQYVILANVPSDWPSRALPFAMVGGGMAHAFFENWLLATGSANFLLFWTCAWLLMRPGHLERANGAAGPEMQHAQPS